MAGVSDQPTPTRGYDMARAMKPLDSTFQQNISEGGETQPLLKNQRGDGLVDQSLGEDNVSFNPNELKENPDFVSAPIEMGESIFLGFLEGNYYYGAFSTEGVATIFEGTNGFEVALEAIEEANLRTEAARKAPVAVRKVATVTRQPRPKKPAPEGPGKLETGYTVGNGEHKYMGSSHGHHWFATRSPGGSLVYTRNKDKKTAEQAAKDNQPISSYMKEVAGDTAESDPAGPKSITSTANGQGIGESKVSNIKTYLHHKAYERNRGIKQGSPWDRVKPSALTSTTSLETPEKKKLAEAFAPKKKVEPSKKAGDDKKKGDETPKRPQPFGDFKKSLSKKSGKDDSDGKKRTVDAPGDGPKFKDQQQHLDSPGEDKSEGGGFPGKKNGDNQDQNDGEVKSTFGQQDDMNDNVPDPNSKDVSARPGKEKVEPPIKLSKTPDQIVLNPLQIIKDLSHTTPGSGPQNSGN